MCLTSACPQRRSARTFTRCPPSPRRPKPSTRYAACICSARPTQRRAADRRRVLRHLADRSAESGPVCVKRALAKLRVAADWHAPVERNLYEARWMRRANAAGPGARPGAARPGRQQRRAGDAISAARRPSAVEGPTARRPRRSRFRRRAWRTALVRIHAATAADPTVAAEFPTDAIFLRHPPGALSARHRARASRPRAATGSAGRDDAGQQARAGAWRCQPEEHPGRSARAGVPGRGMRLVGRSGVRSGLLPQPPAAEMPVDAGARATASWRASMRWRRPTCRGVAWEPPAALEARAAHLLPGLFLARVDGKSPVEYITEAADKDRVRRVARALLARPPDRLADVRQAWSRELAA